MKRDIDRNGIRRRLDPARERLVTKFAGELHGTLFMKVARDDDGPPILIAPATLGTCKDVVRRIMDAAAGAAR